MKALIAMLAVAIMAGCASQRVNPDSLKTVVLKSWGNGAPQLLIDLPNTFKLQESEGPDFTVFYFTDSEAGHSLGIYVGHHPSAFRKDAAVISERPGQISGINFNWREWTADGKARSETHVHKLYGDNAPRDYHGLILHIFTSAHTRANVLRLERFAASLRVDSN